MTHFQRAALALTVTLFIASPLRAAPQIRAPEPAGTAQVIRTAAGDETVPTRRRNRVEIRAQQQQMHTGGGGNSK